ncbi:syntaxin 5 [Fistulifera solaris]|uniref:Syntaxin 5 n=1 Tax=Fistulifera solaris TaxID=1519565 RepID=A0A1Z5KEB5_FISSO|nr:syntaxin 5 [Fistulifera solaris]|eukprot:GAX24442.1 syntaxin 5 [Fistulifera solaris]
MSSNRTHEFMALAQSLPAGSPPPTSANGKKGDSDAYQELRNFHTTAAGISRDIAGTSALLSELSNLVRQGFAQPQDQARMNQLVMHIKSQIEGLNGRLDQASNTMQKQRRKVGQQAGEEAANMMDGLKSTFAEAASDFKKVLQERTDNMKEETDFQKQVYDYNNADDDDPIPNMSSLYAPPVFGGANSNGFPALDLTSSLMSPGDNTSSLPRPHGISSSYSGSDIRQRRPLEYNNSYGSQNSLGGSLYSTAQPPLTPLDIQRMEEERGLQQQLIPDQDYLQQRADAMSQVESNIVELGTIFNKLAVMVQEHREMVQRVDDNVQDANTNINMSMEVLTDTLMSLRTNRMLAFRVFSVLVLFIIAFIIFFA